MKKLWFVIVLLILSGCAFQNIENGLKSLNGKPVTVAFQKLGYPNEQTKIAGSDVYVWHMQNSFTSIQAVNSPSTGTIYGPYGVTNYSGNSTSYVPVQENYFCQIRLIVNQGVIVSGDYQGNLGGCQYYSRAMQGIADQTSQEMAAYKDPNNDPFIQKAYDRCYVGKIGRSVSWKNPNNGDHGTVTPVREGTSAKGNSCREFEVIIFKGATSNKAYQSACKMSDDGQWQIVN